MFPESSTWRADVVRVTADGRRVPVEARGRGTAGTSSSRTGACATPRSATTRTPGSTISWRSSAPRSTGSPPTRRATETRYLEARSRPGTTPTRRVGPRVVRERRMREADARLDRSPRRAARAPGQHARARAAAGLAGPVVLLHLRPFLSDGLDGRIYSDAFYEPYATWYPELPGAVYIGLLWLAAVAAVAMSLGLLTRLATATTFADRRLQPLPVDHALPQQPGLSADRARSAGRGAVRPRAVARRVAAPPPRACRPRPAAPAWPLWLLRFECAVVYGASGFSKLVDPDWFGGTVTWQRVVRAQDQLEAWLPTGRCRCSRTGASTPARPSSSCSPSCSSRSALWWRGTRYAAVWVAVIFHVVDRGLGGGAGLLVPRDRRAARLGRALHARPGPPLRPRRTARQRRFAALVRGLDWLARFRVEPAPPGSPLQLVDRDGTTLAGAPARGVRAEPAARDRLVRAAGAAAPGRATRPPGGPRPCHR